MNSKQTVRRHTVVSMQYSLSNAAGVVVREADSAPVGYLHGVGGLFARLERELETHAAGDIVTVRLLPDCAFGKRDTDLVREVPLGDIPPGEVIEAGGTIVGTDEHGGEVNFRILEVRDDVVVLDGNHPLAGQALVSEVETQGIHDATEEEIRTRKVLA